MGIAMARSRKVNDRHGIIIAGGGFAGGVLALALAECAPAGFRVALVDATPQKAVEQRDARGLALSAAAKCLLEAIGLWPRLAPDAQAIESIEITDSPLNASLRPHFLGFDEEMKAHAPGAYLVEAGTLLKTISEAVASDSSIDVFAPDSVGTYETDPFGVQTRLKSGTTLRAPLLVAADGKRSSLRERAGIKCIGWSYPQRGIVATVAHERAHHGQAVQHFLPAGPFAILPLKGNRSSIVWTEDKTKADTLMEGSDDAFIAELTRRFGHRLGRITLEGPKQAFPLDFQMARAFVGDRLALIGDAAHVVHPLAGQGLNIGLRDVAALTETIVDALRLGLDIGSATTLERYQRWRRFDSAFSGTVMDGLNRLFSNDNAPLRAIRDLGLGLVDRAPGLKRFLVREAAGATGNVPRLMKGEGL
ncbi:MAG: FAD-dependent monooxygenase [Methyloceanibacter sp.]|uniref:FAD-dependent monooxygenase n=1 Tax=Methyloceanibacter sp. TaxID=1965321 RepID=UPI003EE3D690